MESGSMNVAAKPVRLQTDVFDDVVTCRVLRDVRQIVESTIDRRPVPGYILSSYGFDSGYRPSVVKISNDSLRERMTAIVAAARLTQTRMRNLTGWETYDLCWETLKALQRRCSDLLLSLGYLPKPSDRTGEELRSDSVAEVLRCTRRHAQRLARQGKIAGRRHPDGQWRYQLCSVYAYRAASNRR